LRNGRGRAAVLVVALLVVGAAAIARERPQTFWTTDGGALAESLHRAGDGFAVPGRCALVPDEPAVWGCAIEDDPGSGISGGYRLTLSEDDCWTGYRFDHRTSSPRRLASCVGASDHLPPRTTKGFLICTLLGLVLLGLLVAAVVTWTSRCRGRRHAPHDFPSTS
jgi:hypothetical protein